jgi:hypothetical protein
MIDLYIYLRGQLVKLHPLILVQVLLREGINMSPNLIPLSVPIVIKNMVFLISTASISQQFIIVLQNRLTLTSLCEKFK